LKGAFERKEISTQEFEAMSTDEKGPGKLYQLYKVHKKHNPPELPPGRPVISGCGSITENLSLFVDAHTKHLVPELPAYLQDTPDLLRQFETLKESNLPQGSFPVSIDVVGLYTNIPHEDGMRSMEEALEGRKDKTVKTSLLITLLDHVLKQNIFEFNGELYLQKLGTAIGTRVAPTYANLFMAMIDEKVKKCTTGKDFNWIYFYRRFIDDIFVIWTGSRESFLQFMEEINVLHPTIKFTCEFDNDQKSTTFLDTKIKIEDNSIVTDLYRKETDRVQYLLPSSCHPSHIFKNVPYSLALRLVRICSKKELLEKRMNELENMLLSRKYNKNIVKAAIQKAKEIPRIEALKRCKRNPMTEQCWQSLIIQNYQASRK
jgi:hypothetical protein